METDEGPKCEASKGTGRSNSIKKTIGSDEWAIDHGKIHFSPESLYKWEFTEVILCSTRNKNAATLNSAVSYSFSN
jgi:hypothetical protein